MRLTTPNKTQIITTLLLVGICEIGVAVLSLSIDLACAIEPSPTVAPRVIEITAKKFEFTPNRISIKKGVPVILRLTSADRIHGFMSKDFKFDTDIDPGKPTDVAVIPTSAGQYTVICDHYCGAGHGNMKMTVTVVD